MIEKHGRKHRIAPLVIAAILLGMMSLQASEKLELGFRAGIVRARAALPQGHAQLTYGAMTAFSAGFHLVVYCFSRNLGVRPEINYSVQGIKTLEQAEGETIASRYQVSYIQIPVFLFFRIPFRGKLEPRMFLGPYIGLPLKAREVQTVFGNTETRDLGDNLKNPDAGLIFGFETAYRLRGMRILLDVRFQLGLSSITKNIREISYDFPETDLFQNTFNRKPPAPGYLINKPGELVSLVDPEPDRESFVKGLLDITYQGDIFRNRHGGIIS